MAYYNPDTAKLSVPISRDPLVDAMFDFDAKNDVRPHREIAQDIVGKYGFFPTHQIVDEISHALEDAFEIGQKRPQISK